MSQANLINQLRSALAKFTIGLFFIYVASLTTSIAGLEIFSAAIVFFVLFVSTLDRWCGHKKIEWHTIGVEFPLLVFLLVIVAGIFLNTPKQDMLHALREGGLLIYRFGLLIVVMSYGLQLVKNLNGLFMALIGVALCVTCYAIWQHFSGLDLLHHTTITPIEVNGTPNVFPSIGLFDNRLTFANAVVMVATLPWAALLLSQKQVWWQRALSLGLFLILAAGVFFSFGRGAWIALLVMMPVTAVFVSRKAFVTLLLVLGCAFFLVYKVSPTVETKIVQLFSENEQSKEDKLRLWEANLEMFKEHPWIGVGYRQNEVLVQEYYKKLGFQSGPSGHPRSNYIEFLATTGLLGFASYMLFILAFILMTARLYSSIPSTHYWHKVFVLAALGAQVAFHVGGLTHWNFGDDVIFHQFLFWLAVIAYMGQRYYAHIVPDDRSI